MPGNKRLFKFLTLSFLLYGVWMLMYEFWIKPPGKVDHIISENITYFICYALDLLGYNPHYSVANKAGETFIYLSGSTFPIIRVGSSCNGFELLVLFTIFIISYPGRLLLKIPFIIGGLVVIHFFNIFRNLVLTLMTIHHSSLFDLFHRYVFIFMVYGVIFILWMIWANKFSQIKPAHADQS